MTPPPPPPDSATADRWKTQATMLILVTEDYGPETTGVVADWMQHHLGAAADMVGPPDVSANTLVSAASQLATPGLYGLGEPTLSHLDPSAAGLAGWISQSGLWTKMQATQKYVFGVGDWVLAFEVSEGALTIRPAYPNRLWTRTDTVDATKLLELRELRYCRVAPDADACDWFWFCWKIDGQPSLWVEDREGRRCSNLHLLMGSEYAPPEGISGDAYPYRYADGKPFIPFQFYSSEDSGTLWNLSGRRGARVGALNSIVLSTFMFRAALGAAIPPVFALNLQKPSANQRGLQQGTVQGDPSASDSMAVPPGALLFLQESPDSKASPSISVPQTGGNLQALCQFGDGYVQGQFSRMGLAGDQVQRNTSNPTSAGALAITQAAKRMVSAMVAPFYRRCDLAAIRKLAALARLAGVGDWPETGWSISYQQIPLSPDEQQAQREEEKHDKELGLLSTVDLWLRRHPGQSREEAVAHLRRVREEEAALEVEEPTAEEPTAEEPTGEFATGEMPAEDDTSEEMEAETLAEVDAELTALEELIPVDAEGADVDFPAIKASISDIRAILGLK